MFNLNITLPEIIFTPIILFVFSGLSLYNFLNIMNVLSNLSRYSGNPIVKQLKPVLKYCKPAIEAVLGPVSKIKLNLTHLMFMAILIVLLAIAQELKEGNKLARQAQSKKNKKE